MPLTMADLGILQQLLQPQGSSKLNADPYTEGDMWGSPRTKLPPPFNNLHTQGVPTDSNMEKDPSSFEQYEPKYGDKTIYDEQGKESYPDTDHAMFLHNLLSHLMKPTPNSNRAILDQLIPKDE